MMAGWFKLYRGWRDCPAFTNTAFSDQEAWLWLIENAAWAPMHRVAGKGNVIAIDRGQVHGSDRSLSAAWKWDRKRVRRFLTRLEKCKMCHLQRDHSGVIITICNYEEYQGREANVGTDRQTNAGPIEGQSRATQKERKERKEEKEDKNGTAPAGARYAFVGNVIRLTPRDFDQWQSSYPDVALVPTLQARDDWLVSEADEATRRKWFVSTSNHLANLQSKAEVAKREAERERNRITV